MKEFFKRLGYIFVAAVVFTGVIVGIIAVAISIIKYSILGMIFKWVISAILGIVVTALVCIFAYWLFIEPFKKKTN